MEAKKADATEGQAVKCIGGGGEIYRYTGDHLRHYTNPDIAGAWDPNWASPKDIDCAGVPHGPVMEAKKADAAEGQAVKCVGGGGNIYRYTGGNLRHYPNPDIAGSWDPIWASPKDIDCAGVPHGPAMESQKVEEVRALFAKQTNPWLKSKMRTMVAKEGIIL
jgi:hypothetical protein